MCMNLPKNLTGNGETHRSPPRELTNASEHFNRGDFDRVALDRARYLYFLVRQLSEFVSVSLKGVDLITHNQRVLRSLLHAGAEAVGLFSFHHVFGSTHGIADHPSQALLPTFFVWG